MLNQWFKFYGFEYLSDPKIGALNAQERSCWLTLLCLAGSSTIPGVIEFLTVEVLLQKSGISFDPYHPEEWDKCLSVLKKFEAMKMITADSNGVVTIINWNKRQESSLTNAERQARYREKHKIDEIKEKSTLKNKDNDNKVTPVTTKVTLDKIREDKIRIDNSIEIPTKNKKFIKPTVSEIETYCIERKNGINAQKFFDYYEAKGWVIGKSPIKNWQAAVRTWEGNDKKWEQEKSKTVYKNTGGDDMVEKLKAKTIKCDTNLQNQKTAEKN